MKLSTIPAFFAVLVAVLAVQSPVRAASTYTVTSLADDGSSGTLRAAINSANADSGSTINFDGSLVGMITLTSNLPTITASTLIAANNAIEITVDGNNHQFQPFTIDAPGQTVTVDYLTIQNGRSTQGGGFDVEGGELVLEASTVTNCSASTGNGGGIYVASGASANIRLTTLSGCTASSGSGGALYNGGTTTLSFSTVTGNSATFGGGIENVNSFTCQSSLLSQNHATAGNGGGIETNHTATATILSSTLTGNSATGGGGAIECFESAATLSNCTIVGNSAAAGGGINFGDLTLANCILYGDSGGEIKNATGTASSCDLQGGIAAAAGVTDSGGNINANPLLSPLGNYGGETQTLAILPGSPCLGAGTLPLVGDTLDQRGLAIPEAGRYDIGAFESSGFTVASTGGTPQSTAINSAFAAALSGTVTANNPLEPVNGGVVVYSVPPSGASAQITGSPATIAAGAFSATATANGTIGGPYTVTASTGAGPATFTLTNLTNVPTANPQTVGVSVNAATTVTLSGSDPHVPPQTLTYNIVAQPAHGVLSGTAPNLTYTPAANYAGADSFTFTVTNTSNVTSPAATITLNVTASVPTANPQTVAVAFNTATPVTLTGSDPNTPPEALTYNVVNPAIGTLSGTAPNLTYTPAAGKSGQVTFTFTVTNTSHSTSAPATVTLNVAAGTPVANPQTVNVAHNTASEVTLTGSDPNVPAQALTYTVTIPPTLGTLSGTAPNLTYTPNSGASGVDSFSFTVTNTSNVTSTAAKVTVNVATATLGNPVANAQSVSVLHNTATAVTLTGSDPNVPSQPLTYTVTLQPTQGTLSGTAPNLTYTPHSEFSGTDRFSFTVTNTSSLTSAPATVTLTVAGQGQPAANPQTVAVKFNTPANVTLTGSDPNVPAQALTYSVITSPIHGSLSGTAPNLTYTPHTGYSGTDSFSFTVTDTSNVTSAPATVTLTVAPPAAPTANAQTVAVKYNTPAAITLTGTDPNVPAQTLTYSVATHAIHGVLSGSVPNLTYTPNSGFSGTDSFTFKATNTSSLTSAPATVTLTVSPPIAPVANTQTVDVAFQTPANITLTGTDSNVPPQTLTYAIVSNPTHGTLSGSAPNVTYTPNTGFSGPDSFTFKVTNSSNLASAAAAVILNVAPGTPTATAQSVNVPFNTPANITLAGSDPNVPAQSLTYAVTAQPTKGTLTGTAPNLVYTPSRLASGADSFTFTVTNTSSLTSAAATVSITIAPPLHAFLPGIQMISVPTSYADESVASVLGYASPVLAVWNPTTDVYAISPTPPTNALVAGQGYWVRIPASGAAIATAGTAPQSQFTISLARGWNTIGCPQSTPVAVSSLTVIDSSNVSHTFAEASFMYPAPSTGLNLVQDPLYTFQAGDTAYEVVTGATGMLQPYYGYWLYASAPCTLAFP